MNDNPWLRILIILLTIIAALYLLGHLWSLAMQLGDIISLFFLAWLVAFLLNPITKLLCRRLRLSRPLAAGVVYLATLSLVIVAFILAIPVLGTQISQLATAAPGYVSGLSDLSASVQQQLSRLGINVEISTFYRPETINAQVQSIGTNMAQNMVSFATGLAAVIFNVLIVFILSFYFTVDGPRMARQALRAAPRVMRPEVHHLFDSIEQSFGGFVRGQVVLALLCTFITAIAMMVAGLPYVLVVGMFVFVAMLIPFIGPFLALAPPLLIGFTQLPLPQAVILAVVLVVLQSTVLNVLSPKIMGEALGIHPLVVFLSMLAGAKVAGVGGAIFGVPIAGVMNAMIIFMYQRAKKGQPYKRMRHRLVTRRTGNFSEVVRSWLPR
jgi:predicted PurR-regulated permease PerM